jgi:alcohol dehydrogenase (NADP+)
VSSVILSDFLALLWTQLRSISLLNSCPSFEMQFLFVQALLASVALAQNAPHFLDKTPAKGTVLDAPPRIGLGTWYMRGTTAEAVAAAIEHGYRHIDAAKVYGNQRDVGKGIALGLKRTGLTRKDIWVTSKLWNSE